jgi:four helix bundle protein
VRDHHSLIAWQRAREFVLAVYRVCNDIWHPSIAPLIEQLRRSALSVQLNISEGYALGSPALFRRHLTIAYGSAIESMDIVELLIELSIGNRADITALWKPCDECRGLVLGLKHSIEEKE